MKKRILGLPIWLLLLTGALALAYFFFPPFQNWLDLKVKPLIEKLKEKFNKKPQTTQTPLDEKPDLKPVVSIKK